MKQLFILSLMCCSAAMAGDWKLSEGTVHFTSVKNGNAPVSGTIEATGHMKAGKLEVTAALGSVVTGDLVRDINLKTWLFEVAANPKMVITGDLPTNAIPAKIGEQKTAVVEATVSYRGLKAPMKVSLVLVRTGEKTVRSTTNRNVTMTLASLGLAGKPLETLIRVCAHESVGSVAFLSFDGVWSK